MTDTDGAVLRQTTDEMSDPTNNEKPPTDLNWEGRDDAGLPGSGKSPNASMSVSTYIKTRISTLKPPMDDVENPFKLLMLLNTKQWMFFLVAFTGWTWDR